MYRSNLFHTLSHIQGSNPAAESSEDGVSTLTPVTPKAGEICILKQTKRVVCDSKFIFGLVLSCI